MCPCNQTVMLRWFVFARSCQDGCLNRHFASICSNRVSSEWRAWPHLDGRAVGLFRLRSAMRACRHWGHVSSPKLRRLHRAFAFPACSYRRHIGSFGLRPNYVFKPTARGQRFCSSHLRRPCSGLTRRWASLAFVRIKRNVIWEALSLGDGEQLELPRPSHTAILVPLLLRSFPVKVPSPHPRSRRAPNSAVNATAIRLFSHLQSPSCGGALPPR